MQMTIVSVKIKVRIEYLAFFAMYHNFIFVRFFFLGISILILLLQNIEHISSYF